MRANALAHTILAITAIGGITLVALLAPNAFQLLGRQLGKDDWWTRREANRKRTREALERLRKRRLIVYEERGKETYLKITREGKTIIRRFAFDEMTLPISDRWDNRWRLVIFDIPESKAKERKILHDRLAALGFHNLQKSVLVYPHPCRDEVDFMSTFLDVLPYVLYLETNDLGQREGTIRKHFGLL